MKKTGVVQGLKSLADKIHPNGNAPLTAGESKRLLTALTSSFRRQLDAAHPTTIKDDRKEQAERGAVPPINNISGLHSSAAFAQEHMAFVLTHPLLLGNGKSYVSAKVELQENPHSDPIKLLEQYSEEGAATVSIAGLCLEHVRRMYDASSDIDKPKLLDELQPGRRVFRWLLQSGIYKSETYVDNARFLELITLFLIHEGREQDLWQWIKLDIKDPDQPIEGASSSAVASDQMKMLYRYRWRSRLLACMVQHKAGVSREASPSRKVHGKAQTTSARRLNAAIDTYLEGDSLRAPVGTGHNPVTLDHMAWLSLGPSASFLVTLLCRRLLPLNHQGDVELLSDDTLDPERFDRLYQSISLDLYADRTEKEWGLTDVSQMITLASLQLAHPVKPSATLAFQMLRNLLPDDSAQGVPAFFASLESDEEKRRVWYNTFVKCPAVLAREDRHDDAVWVRKWIPALFSRKLARSAEDHELRYRSLCWGS